MKFLKTYAVCLVASEVFLICGGYMLFDFIRHPFRAFAAIAFILAVLITVWLAQEERIDALEKRVRDLGERVWTLEDPERLNDSENKENDQ
ncbi:hypothetical protein [uncultured Oscillibacter sp.]|uniref:hypothetical protein n=1 Tax=uncultured Oscillibacter sp. TaxID=876091 RepID=UPI0025FB9A93|nr:hypothetical protein [uncultured Oscillibacter sp.]